MLVRGRGAMGRGRVAGLDRGNHGFERQICWMDHWQVFQEDDCFEGERKSGSPLPNCTLSEKLTGDSQEEG